MVSLPWRKKKKNHRSNFNIGTSNFNLKKNVSPWNKAMSRGPWCKSEEERKERQRASFERCVARNEERYRQLAKERSKRLYKLRKELLRKITKLNSTQLKEIVASYCPADDESGVDGEE